MLNVEVDASGSPPPEIRFRAALAHQIAFPRLKRMLRPDRTHLEQTLLILALVAENVQVKISPKESLVAFLLPGGNEYIRSGSFYVPSLKPSSELLT